MQPEMAQLIRLQEQLKSFSDEVRNRFNDSDRINERRHRDNLNHLEKLDKRYEDLNNRVITTDTRGTQNDEDIDTIFTRLEALKGAVVLPSGAQWWLGIVIGGMCFVFWFMTQVLHYGPQVIQATQGIK